MTTPIPPEQQPEGVGSSGPQYHAAGARGEASSAPGGPSPHAPFRSAAAKTATATTAILAVTASIGGIALAAVGASAAYAAFAPHRANPLDTVVGSVASGVDAGVAPLDGELSDDAWVNDDGDVVRELAVDDVTALDLEVAGASLRLQFADVAAAELAASGPGADDWRLGIDQGELQVSAPERGLTTGCLFDCGAGGLGRASATLTLPEHLSDDGGLDAEISVEGGSIAASGAFQALELSVEAGSARITGSAARASVDIEAGDANIELADVRTAQLDLDMGSARVELTGTAPDRVEIEASASDADIRLPRESYRVDEQKELGDLDNDLEIDEESKHRVVVSVEAARVGLS